MPSVVIVGFIAVAVLVALLGTKEIRRIKNARFAGREVITSEEFYNRFYRAAGFDPALVEAVRERVATGLEISAGLLRPTDRFDGELAPAEGWEQWWDDGLAMIRQKGLEIGGEIRNVDWRRVNTLDDLIKEVARLGS